MIEQEVIVLADYDNDVDYRLIKGKSAFKTLELHRHSLEQAKANFEHNNVKVVFEVCDLMGYQLFLRKNNIINSPQNVASYVVAKHYGKLDKDFSELKHQNIEIVED